jgi:hypothetical protein
MNTSFVLRFSRVGVRSLGLCVLACLCVTMPLLNSATYMVTATTPDLNVLGTLRFAMNSANFNAGADTILFNISGAGPHYIMPDSQLPVLTDQAGVFIDGLSQTGATAGANPPASANLMIVLDGTNAGAAHGIHVWSSNNTIQGLVVNNFQQDGIRVQARPDMTQNNYVYCNFVGTDQTGNTVQGNGWNQQGLWAGIYVICTPGTLGVAHNNVVDRNLASGNYAEGIGIASCPPGDVAFNGVLSNYVGTDAGGTVDLGNIHDGVYIGEGAHDNVVDGNIISGNDFEGVCIIGYAEAIPPVYTYANIVANNIIGLAVSFSPLPNTRDGVSIGIYGTWYQGGYAPDNIIAANTIAHNGRNGVLVWEHYADNANCDFNQITQNSMYNNTMLGIDLGDDGVTANDLNDPDAGANEELNFPVITSAVESAGQTTIAGNLNIDSDPTQALIEVFKASADPSGYGEGGTYLGTASANASGNWSVVVGGLVAGDTITATTTDLTLNTSEFGQNFTVVTGIEETEINLTTKSYDVGYNHPNPFALSTSIDFALPEESSIEVKIYDVSGRIVKTLAEGSFGPALHTLHWSGTDTEGHKVSPGVYILILDAGEFKAVRKMVVTK